MLSQRRFTSCVAPALPSRSSNVLASSNGTLLCVTLNAALDVTYVVDGVRWHSSNRVVSTRQRGGGKGVNVARVLYLLGQETLITGFVAGGTGRLIMADVMASQLPAEFLVIEGESRQTLAVVDTVEGDATGFSEPGPHVAEEDWTRFLTCYDRLLRRGVAGVVLSGSLPPGLPEDAYALLVSAAHTVGVPVALDADGLALRLGAAAGADVLKPNLDELRAATGRTDPLTGARDLLQSGAQAVVVSAGSDGLIAVTNRGRWAAKPPERVRGNPTGAGDACVAALARNFVSEREWPLVLADAVALSAAAVLCTSAGDVDVDLYQRFRGSVVVEEL
jgi:1-phosphofructokinase family hexose kinase